MAGRIVLGALLGGAVMFVWGAVSHMATPLGMMGFSRMTVAQEAKALTTLQEATPSSGLYHFPGIDMTKPVSDDEQKAWEAKVKAGPSGILVITKGEGEDISPKRLLTEFGSNVAAAFVGAVILAMTRVNYLGRVCVLTLIGLCGWLSINVSYWNWYAFPTDFTLAAAIDEVVGWTLMGLIVAALVRPRRGADGEAVAV